MFIVLAAPSSFRCLVVGPSVRWSSSLWVLPSKTFVKKMTFRVSNCNQNLPKPTYLCDSSDRSDTKLFSPKNFYPKSTFFTKNHFFTNNIFPKKNCFTKYKKFKPPNFFFLISFINNFFFLAQQYLFQQKNVFTNKY